MDNSVINVDKCGHIVDNVVNNNGELYTVDSVDNVDNIVEKTRCIGKSTDLYTNNKQNNSQNDKECEKVIQ